jgi:hypothetical protein
MISPPPRARNPTRKRTLREPSDFNQARMSSYNFSWETTPLAWPARLGAWNPRSENYRTPVPCKHGSNCLFTGICSFVHPGEEGTGLKYFPGRSYLAEDGTECWESAVVRLIGGARYYERRRLRLSWSAWCARVGLPLPVRPSGRRERLDLSPAPEVEIVGEDEFVATAEDEQRAVGPSAEQQQAAWAVYQQVYAQQIAYQQWLFQQRLLAQQPVLTEVQQKQQLGDALYPLVKSALERSAADREVIGFSGPGFTAGKITGMLLEGCSVDELRELLEDDAKFSPLLMEACEVLSAAKKPATTVEVREARASVTGIPSLAACVDDSLRELMEDIRREDAGLPPIERPPTITSYEPQADGKVRVVKTTFPQERATASAAPPPRTTLPMPPRGEEAWADAADEAAQARVAGWQKAGDQLRRQAMKNARGARR